MARYTVTIVEKSFTDIEVTADSQEQAEALALAKLSFRRIASSWPCTSTDIEVHSVDCHDTNTMVMK